MVANIEIRINEEEDTKVLLANGVLIAFMYNREDNHIDFVFKGTEEFDEIEQYMTIKDFPKQLMDFDIHTAISLTSFIDICNDDTKEYHIQYCDYPSGYIYILEKDNTKDIETEAVFKKMFEYKLDKTIYDHYKAMDISEILTEHNYVYNKYMENIGNMKCVNCTNENINKNLGNCPQEYCKRMKACMDLLEDRKVIEA